MDNFKSQNTKLHNRKFQFWEFKVSHGQLLIRSPKPSLELSNIDIIFSDVEYVMLPRHLKEISISKGTIEDLQKINFLTGKVNSAEKLFVLTSEEMKSYVVANFVEVEENTLEVFESSLTSYD